MNKYIKLFENYSTEEEQMEAIYESVMNNLLSKGISLDFINARLNEQEEWYEEEGELTPGEKAAATRGLQLMTRSQMAAIYLWAKGRVEEKGADYVKMITGIEPFGYIDETDGDFRITIPAMADAIGMDSDRTLSYTLSKFENLINNIGETPSQSLSPKLITAYNALSQMPITNVVARAGDSIQDSSNTVNRDAADSRRETTNVRTTERRAERRAEDRKIALIMNDLVKGFKDQEYPIENYSKMIYAKLKKDYPNIGVNRMYDAFARYLMNSGQDISIYINRPSVA
jgi:hypothetical protein